MKRSFHSLRKKQSTNTTKPEAEKRGSITPFTIGYTALNDNFDFFKVVKWKVFDMKNEAHVKILQDQEDPISYEELLEVGMSGEDEIVQLPCATEKMRCNFTKTSIIKCLRAQPTCPVCSHYYPIPGTQPSGTMNVYVDKGYSCQGYPNIGSIIISCNFPGGIMGQNHPNPGKKYGGANKAAYLPNNDEGKKALDLILLAFNRGQLFTIGKSFTLGGGPRVVFSSIHLKSSPNGGEIYHGWPDPTYFERLRQECAAKMIFDDHVAEEIKGTTEGTSTEII